MKKIDRKPGSRSRPLPVAALVAALAISAFGLTPATASAAEQGCPANSACTYTQVNFEGFRFVNPCSEAGTITFGSNVGSARNRCGSKLFYLLFGGSSVCMNPGGDRPNPGTFYQAKLPASYVPPYC
jgi:hypothetical protein